MNYCLGTVQFGMNYGIQGNGRLDADSVETMLEYAYANGIEILDTAAVYGDAENILGRILHRNKKLSRFNIVSKLAPNAFDGVDSCEWRKVAVQNAEKSGKTLGVPKLHSFLFHNASYIFDPQAVDALQAVCDQGIADRIGVSIYTPVEAMKALEYKSIKVIQIPYNVFDSRLDRCGFFEKAQEQDVLIFARSSLLQGLVMMDPDRLPENVRFAENSLRTFLKICERYQCSPLEAAVGYVGCNPRIDYVVFGADNSRQLQEYLSFRQWSVPPEMLIDIQASFKDVEEKLVNPSMWRKGE